MSPFRRRARKRAPADTPAISTSSSEDNATASALPVAIEMDRLIPLPSFPDHEDPARAVEQYADFYVSLERAAVMGRNTNPSTALVLLERLGVADPVTYTLQAPFDSRGPDLFDSLRPITLDLQAVAAWDAKISSGSEFASALVVDIQSAVPSEQVLLAFGLHDSGLFLAHYFSPDAEIGEYDTIREAIRDWPTTTTEPVELMASATVDSQESTETTRDWSTADTVESMASVPVASGGGEVSQYEIAGGYSYARDRLRVGMAFGSDEDKTLSALGNVVAVIDEYVSSSRHRIGGQTVIGGFDFLEMTQRVNQLRNHPGGINELRRADRQVPMIRPMLAGLKMLVLVSDCGVSREEVPDQLDELLSPTGPPEVDEVIKFLLFQFPRDSV